MILEGNPAGTDLVEQMLDCQQQIYGRYPLKVALDGGFASKDNLIKTKDRKIKDVCFAKSAVLKRPTCAVASMCTKSCGDFEPESNPEFPGSSAVSV
mgnify:CR=1 FL=1